MQENPTKDPQATPLWQKIALALFGIGLAYGLITVLLLLFPNLLPGADFAERRFAGTRVDVQFRLSDGDLFVFKPEHVRPIAPEEDRVLETFTLEWDADGFRVPQRVAEAYPIVAFGDSFTEGANVPVPWADRVAELLDTPVRNLGYRNHGPYENADVARSFGAAEPRTWVLYGHFSGNDLSDALRTEEQRIAERSPFYLIPWAAQRAGDNVALQAPRAADPDANYTYPMPVVIGGTYYELALHENLLWWQLAPRAGYASSRSYGIVAEALDTVAEATPDACRALIFIPTKEQLYYEYIDWGARRWLLPVAQRPTPLENGILVLQPDARSKDSREDDADLIAHLSDQRDAMAAMAAEKGWIFVDLLEPFREQVAQGELLYYQYDTHWNQAGHNLAAARIVDAMRQHPECPLTFE